MTELLYVERTEDADDGRPLLQFRCAGCGYGASCRVAPERCPMCGGATWGHLDRDANEWRL